MRALVTGGAGFIGSHLVDRLVDDGADVVVLDDLSAGTADDVNPKADLIEGDVSDPLVAAEAVRAVHRCEVVFHLAAHRAVLRSMEHPLATDRANVAGTLTMLAAARDAGVRRVVLASSSSVYGAADALPTREDTVLRPLSPYAVSKLAGEHYARVWSELYGLETVSLRYFNVYGPRQRPDSRYAAVIPLFIGALHDRVPPVVHGDGLQSRDFTFVSDAVAASVRAASASAGVCSGRAYNIAGGRSYSLLELLAVLAKLVGMTVEPHHAAPRPGDMRHTSADIAAARLDLGHEPEVSLEDGLRLTIEWYRSVYARSC